MIFLSILILIVAIALPSINQNIRSILYTRISSIVFIYAGALALNALYIQSIGSGIGIYSGLFQVTNISQLLDVFILLIGSFILIAWPSSLIPASLSFSHNHAHSMTGTVVFKFITPLHSLIISTAPSLITYHSINAMNATTFMDMYVRSFMSERHSCYAML